MRATFARPVLASSALAGLFGVLAPGTASAAQGTAQTQVDTVPSVDAGARARARYESGTAAFSDGRFVEAALDFEAAAEEKSSPVALYTAALSWERADAPERAADDYTRALTIGGLAPDSTSRAAQRLATLEAVLATLVVTAPARWRAQLDAGSELPLPATFHAASGAHTLTVHPAGGEITRTPVSLRAGVTAHIALPEPEPPVRAATGGLSARRTVGLVALGAAGATLLSGALLGVEALGARDSYGAAPTQSSYNHAVALERWTNAAWIAGGTLLAGGLVLALWPSPRASTGASRSPIVGVDVRGNSIFIRGGFR